MQTTMHNVTWRNRRLVRAAEKIGFEPEGLNYLIKQVNPLWSILDLQARVERVIDETHDTKTFVFRPNKLWRGIEAGQHIGVNVEIDGVTHTRRYSLSCAQATSADEARLVQVTVKRVEGGLVSNYLHNNIKAGDVLSLEQADGDFVLPTELPSQILVLTAGSGITPVFSQVATLLADGYKGDIQFIHYVRSLNDRIFGQSLEGLARQYSNFTVQWCYEAAEGQKGPERFSPKQLAARVADYRDRQTLLCGPGGFMEAVREHWAKESLTEQLGFEYFGAPPVNAADAIDAEVTLGGGKQIQLNAGQTLLDALLENGETPKYGCKRGVCHECKCRKQSGAVKNLLTGKVSGAGEEDIQLCISAPVTDITLG